MKYSFFRALFFVAIAISPALLYGQTGYHIYFGDFHSHTWYSDGNQDQNPSRYLLPVAQAITFAHTVGGANMNFLGVSDHNHNEGGLKMTLAYWNSGKHEADSLNQDGAFVGMYGQEWGVISGGGHVCIYGTDKLFGWDAGIYDVYVTKSNYSMLWDSVAKYGGFCYLAHPQSGDFGNLAGGTYNALADSIVSGVAVKSGPATSTNKTETDPASGNYESVYHALLAKGYHVAPCAHQDNHNTTYGMVNQQRTGVVTTSLTRANILSALRNRHAYCSEDHNLQVQYSCGSHIMGDIFRVGSSTATTLRIKIVDPDAGETVSSIVLRYGVPGSGSLPTTLASVSGKDSLIYTYTQATGTTNYYYAYVTMSNGYHAWSAPMWITGAASVNPPAAFTLTSPSNGSSGRPLADSLKWAASSGATGYTVYLDTLNPPVKIAGTGQTATSFYYSGLLYTHTYYWKVTATNPDGSTDATGSPWSFSTVSSSAPSFSASPVSIAFGSVAIGASKNDSIVVTNGGTAALTISSAQADNSRFTVAPSSASVPVGASQKFTVTFTPAATAAQSGNIVFSHTAAGSPSSVAVTGSGAQLQITATAQTGGTISPSGTVNVNYGGSQAFTVAASTGSHIDSLLVDGVKQSAAAGQSGYSYTFSSISSSHTISAYFGLNAFTITASAGTGGSISPSGAVSAGYGGSQAFTVTATTGYHIDSVKVDGSNQSAASGQASYTYTFSNVTANHAIAASFALNMYSITATAGTGGAISPSGAVSVSYGGSQAYAVTTTAGYHIDSVKVDGSRQPAAAGQTGYNYTFSNVGAAHSIAAYFGLNSYTITASAGTTGGSISPSGVSTVQYGGSANYTIGASTNYHISDVVVDGQPAGAVSSYSFSNVSANHTIVATFAVDGGYIITAGSNQYGTITPSGFISVFSGHDTSVVMSPQTGAHIDSVIVDGTNIGAVSGHTFSNVTADHSIRAVFALNTYTITAAAGPGGSVSPSGSFTTAYGSAVTIAVTPSRGYIIDSVIVDGVNFGRTNSYKFSYVTGSHVLSAKFKLVTYTINTTAIGNGAITPPGPVTAIYQSDYSFTVAPAIGSHLDSLFIDGAPAALQTAVQFDSVTQDHSIRAKFALDTFTIAATYDPRGVVVPVGTARVTYGSDVTYTIIAGNEVDIDTVLVDGICLPAAAGQSSYQYTFSAVSGNHTISAKFRANTFTITATAGAHGTLSPSGAVPVHIGHDTTFTAAPDAGYELDNLTVDGIQQGAASSGYTFHSVAAAHTIEASFTQSEYRLNVAIAGSGNIHRSPDMDIYTYGMNVQLMAIPNTGYKLSSWSGDITAADTDTVSVFIDGHKNITATFSPIPLLDPSVWTLTFDATLAGESEVETIDIGNPGAAPLVLSSIATATGDFSVTPDNAIIAPSDHATLQVSFHPDAFGRKADSIILVHNASASPTIVSLRGTCAPFTVQVPVQQRWNLVSNPFDGNEDSVRALFPASLMHHAYFFDPLNGYVEEIRLRHGCGYWEKFSDSGITEISGMRLTQDAFHLAAGWNLIGSISVPVLASGITASGMQILTPFYGYNQGYAHADTIVPGKAYWVKVDGPGDLLLSAPGKTGLQSRTVSAALPVSGLASIEVQDAGANTQTLYLDLRETESTLDRYELPPVPPQGVFDVRFGSQRVVESLPPETGKQSRQLRIDISSAQYPVTFSFNGFDGAKSQIMATDLSGRILGTTSASHDGSIRIANSEISSIMLKILSLPKEYALGQNYPNPFNPTSIIEFELPLPSRVTVKIFDVLGREIQTLLRGEVQAAGLHQVEMNGAAMSSGVYFYRIEATSVDGPQQSFSQTRKMALIR